MGLVCASAGNHAQGFALSCSYLNKIGGGLLQEQLMYLSCLKRGAPAMKKSIEQINKNDNFVGCERGLVENLLI